MSAETSSRSHEDENVQTVTTTGNPVKKRIANSKAAHSLFKKLKLNDDSNALSRARLSAIYDGNPPYSNAELRRRGLGWCSNIDWGEFRNAINESATSMWNMFNSSETLITCSTDFKDPQQPGIDWGSVIANEFSEVVRAWINYGFVTMSHAMSMIKFGVGSVMWPDVNDWRPKAICEGCMLVPRKTKSSQGEISTAIILDEMSPHDVFKLIEDETEARELGWNVAYLKKKMVSLYIDGEDPTQNDEQSSSWESQQNAIATKIDDMNEDDLKLLRVVHLFSEEVSGEGDEAPGVTHQIIVEDDNDESEFIFEKTNRFKSISEVLHVMLYHIGNGKMKSVRGLGREIYYASHVSNRMLNNIVDGVTISSGLMLKPTAEVTRESMLLVRQGPLTMLPANAEIIQQQYHPNLSASADARNLLNSVNANQSGGFKSSQETAAPVQRTGKEVEISHQDSANVKQDQASWLYSQRKEFVYELFRRLMSKDYPQTAGGYEDHKTLMDALKARGLPKKLYDVTQWKVKVPIAIGLGNRTQAMSVSNQMVKMKGGLDEDGRRNVDRIWWALRVGWDQVDNFVPMHSRDEIVTIGHTLAEGENIDMKQGERRQVAVDDPHMIHFTMHIKYAANILQLVQAQQMDPEAGFQAFGIVIQHCQIHVDQMSLDETRANQVKQAGDAIKQLVEASQQLVQQVKEIQAQREQAAKEEQARVAKLEKAPTDREFELQKYKIDKEMQIKAIDTENQNQTRNAKTMAKLQTDFQETIAKIANLEQITAANTRKIDAENNNEKEDTNGPE
jgi:hypothetical protein